MVFRYPHQFGSGAKELIGVGSNDAERALAMLTARHIDAWRLGEVRPAEDGAEGAVLNGEYKRA